MTFRGYVHEDTGSYQWDPLELEKFRAICRAKFKGQEVELEIRPRRQKRSVAQNRAIHAMLRPWCEEGHYIDDLKRDLLKAVFGTHERVSPLTGEVELVPNKPHTSQLTVQEFSELVEKSVIIAAECGVILELPDEYKLRHPLRYPPEKRKRAA
jgi:hypothetical protein